MNSHIQQIRIPTGEIYLLSIDEVTEAYNLAKAKWEYNEKKRGGKVWAYPNSLERHFIGKLGEFAAYGAAKFREYYPVPNFKQNDSLCDIWCQHPPSAWEVKSWREDAFPDMGYAVSEAQVKGILSKCNKIVWCAVPVPAQVKEAREILSIAMDTYGMDVRVVGWNPVSDFKNLPPVERYGLVSRQLSSIGEIRDIEEL